MRQAPAPMDMTTQLTPEQVLVGVEASDKWGLLERMFEVAWRMRPRVAAIGPDREELWQRLCEEEDRKPSDFGRGLAFPHVRCERLAAPSLCVGLLGSPLDFGSLDGTPATIVCLILVPDDHPTVALRVISLLARLCAEP